MIRYKIKFSANLGNVLPLVGDMLKRVNDEVSSLGLREKLEVRSKLFNMTFTSKNELTNKQRSLMKAVMLETANAKFPAWQLKIESFRRQSGNVQSSAS